MSPAAPALVTRSAARRLPRVPLLLLCAAYLLPGLVGRDPWRNADLVATATMIAMAEGRTPWLTPALGGVALEVAGWPHWLGAASVVALSPLLGTELAVRLPFALLLAATMALSWYACFHLARTDAAQPMPLVFGGEAPAVDYARAVADGALLALIATLGLLQLGHETTPELGQLAAMALWLWALAAAPFRRWRPRVAIVLALPLLAAAGAPAVALAAGALAAAICALSTFEPARRLVPYVLAGAAASVPAAVVLGTWRAWPPTPFDFEPWAIARQWLWFLWPCWPLALWTLVRWRAHWRHRHVSVPLASVLAALGANLALAGSDRALLLALPGLALLAAFALPTLARGTSAAIDWFSVCFFTIGAAAIWVIYAAVVTGVPAKPAANVAKLAPGFEMLPSAAAIAPAALATLAWLALVRWRTGRHREALWKTLVLPAGGVALVWLLLMTLWLPLLDYARSPRVAVARIAALVPAGSCLAAPGTSAVLAASLEHFGGYLVDRRAGSEGGPCEVRLTVLRTRGAAPPAAPGWQRLGEVRRPTDRDELLVIERRIAPAGDRRPPA
jgi:hypothetical protein